MSKILVLTSREIYPLYGGDKLRMFKICEYLSQFHSLDIVSLTDKKEFSYQAYPKVEEVFDKTWSIFHRPLKAKFFSLCSIFSKRSMQEWYYYNPKLYNFLKEKRDKYDHLLVHLFRMEQYANNFNASGVHVELTDAISMNYSRLSWRSLRNFMEVLYYFDREKILRREKKILQKYPSVSLISDTDKEYLSQFESVSNVNVFKNGVNIDRFKIVDGVKENTIVFIGNIGTTQNKDACQFFIDEILPSINKKYPKLKFKIVGIIPEQIREKFEEYSNVIVTGKVKSIQEAVGNPLCAVCPMRYGAGIQNKILEYMAMGIPVISSGLGTEGLEDLQNNIFRAESSQDYLKAIEKIKDGTDIQTVDPQVLRNSVEKKYSWDQMLEGFEELFI